MEPRKILYILRHAKAAAGSDDHVRPLAERGIHESEAMGKFLAVQDMHIQKVWCSTSLRTRETWQHVQKHYKQHPAVEYTDKLYLASAETTLKFIATLPEEISNVMLIGHNPGLHELCIKLIKSGDDHLRRQLTASFPPCSLASIVLTDVAWKDITLGGTLAEFKVMEVGS